MWVFTRKRDEHDNGDLVNLDHGSRIHLNQLGERWFVDIFQGSDTVSLAQVKSQDEAIDILRIVFDNLAAGTSAIDLNKRQDQSDDRPDGPVIA